MANLWLVLPTAGAQDDLTERRRESAELTGQAAIAFNAGDLESARDLLLKAREAFANPIIDYNLGRAYEGLGQAALARDAYTRYLIAVPDAANAGLVRQRIEALAEASSDPQPLGVPAETESDHETPDKALREPGGVSAWPFLIGGVGLAAAGVGLGLSLDAQAQADDALVDPVNQVQAAEDVEAARSQNTLGNVLIISGASMATAGLVWLIVELAGGEADQVQARGTSFAVAF